MLGTGSGHPRRTIGRSPIVAVVPTILDPFDHISMRVVQPEVVRSETADRQCLFPMDSLLASPIDVIAIEVRLISRDCRSGRKHRCRPCPPDVFPLGF